MSNDRLPRSVFAGAVLGLAFAAAPAARAESHRVAIAVLNFDDRGAGPNLTSNVASLVSNELSRFPVLQVISSHDIGSLISVEAQRQLLGCGDASCLTNLSAALGTEYIVSGNVGKVGATYLITLQLIRQSNATVEDREELHTDGSLESLIHQIQETARRLIRPILKARRGSLLLTANVEGASVSVDDKLVGSTPLNRLEVTWGPHTIRVERNGFIAVAKDIDVDSDATSVLDVVLVPSAEFIAAYESRHRALRNGAWATGAIAVAGGAVALAFGLEAQGTLSTFNTKLSTLATAGTITISGSEYRYASASAQAQDEPGLQSLRNTGALDTTITRVGLAVGLAAAVTSVVLFAVGEDPGKYEKFKAQRVSAVEPSLSLDGTSVALRF
jgi:TolB-like protein